MRVKNSYSEPPLWTYTIAAVLGIPANTAKDISKREFVKLAAKLSWTEPKLLGKTERTTAKNAARCWIRDHQWTPESRKRARELLHLEKKYSNPVIKFLERRAGDARNGSLPTIYEVATEKILLAKVRFPELMEGHHGGGEGDLKEQKDMDAEESCLDPGNTIT